MGIPTKETDQVLRDNSQLTFSTGTVTSPQTSHVRKATFEMRLMRVRKNATARERRRLAEVNCAYTDLSRQVPQQFLGNATKLEVLRGATRYIQMLMMMLGENDSFDGYHGNNGAYSTKFGEVGVEPRTLKYRSSSFESPTVRISQCSENVGTDTSHEVNSSRHSLPQANDRNHDNEDSELSSSAAESGEEEQSEFEPKDTYSLAQSGVLIMDDPPPKANISWH